MENQHLIHGKSHSISTGPFSIAILVITRVSSNGNYQTDQIDQMEHAIKKAGWWYTYPSKKHESQLG